MPFIPGAAGAKQVSLFPDFYQNGQLSRVYNEMRDNIIGIKYSKTGKTGLVKTYQAGL